MGDTDAVTARTQAELEAGLDEIRRSPADEGTVRLIVRRPATDEREVVESAQLDVAEGLVGDAWRSRGSRSTPDGGPDPDAQITLMNARVAGLIAHETADWAAAGDQLYVDLDLSEANLPTGTRLAVGNAVLEVSPKPHTGCAKFGSRYGSDALRFVNGADGRPLRLRGMNVRVVQGGTIKVGDWICKA